MRNNFEVSCMLFAAGGSESASQIAKRFNVSRQAVYQKAANYRDILGLKKRPDRRFREKIVTAGLLSCEATCP
jgi:hypothetical protein